VNICDWIHENSNKLGCCPREFLWSPSYMQELRIKVSVVSPKGWGFGVHACMGKREWMEGHRKFRGGGLGASPFSHFP